MRLHPKPRVEIAFRQVHRDQSVDLIAAVNGREWVIRWAVERGPEASGYGAAVRGSHPQIQTLALFFPRGIAKGQRGLGESDRCGASNSTLNGGYAARVRDQAELGLRIGCGLNLAEQEAQQKPCAGQGQEGNANSFSRSNDGDQSEQQSGGDEYARAYPAGSRYHHAAGEPKGTIERRRGGEAEPLEDPTANPRPRATP